MHFLTFVALILPLSALAAPTLVRRQKSDGTSFETLKTGVDKANDALGQALSSSNSGQQLPDVLNAVKNAHGALTAFQSFPAMSNAKTAVDKGDAIEDDDLIAIYDIFNSIAAVVDVNLKTTNCGKTLDGDFCTNISNARTGLSSARTGVEGLGDLLD